MRPLPGTQSQEESREAPGSLTSISSQSSAVLPSPPIGQTQSKPGSEGVLIKVHKSGLLRQRLVRRKVEDADIVIKSGHFKALEMRVGNRNP